MSKESRYIALLEKLLTHLKNAKLEYFKASDHAVSADKKRYYNQQALQRNRFFQDVLQELYRFGMTSEDLGRKNKLPLVIILLNYNYLFW